MAVLQSLWFYGLNNIFGMNFWSLKKVRGANVMCCVVFFHYHIWEETVHVFRPFHEEKENCLLFFYYCTF